jgi:hypothetical protein
MRWTFAIIVSVSTVAACAADTMRTYVGQDIRAVELAYGPPSNQIDLGNSGRAFQWTRVSVDSTPISAVTTTKKDKKGRKTTETQFIGGDQSVTNCIYTFITSRNAQSGGWVVTGIREPSFECAVGGLN